MAVADTTTAKRKRMSPAERRKLELKQMTKRDSLVSFNEFGGIYPPSEWSKMRAKKKPKKPSWNPFTRIWEALGGGKK